MHAQLAGEELVSGEVKYKDLFGDVYKQKVVVTLFTKLLDIRKTMAQNSQQETPDPSISDKMLKNSYNLHHSIVNSSSGK